MSFKSYTDDGLFAIMETTLAQLSSYLRMNHLSLNISKTKYTIFSNIQHFETNKILSFGNVVIEGVTNFNYLGMIIGEMIAWKDHVRALSIKISRGTDALNRLKHFIPHKALKTLCYTLVFSCLESN